MQPLKIKAMSLLARKSYFAKELKDKLLRSGYEAEGIDVLIEEFKQKKYLNDEELAQRFIEKKLQRGYSAKVIQMQLQEKMGKKEPLKDSKEFLQNLIKKKYSAYDKKRLILTLLRKGFAYGTIQEVLNVDLVE